MPRHCRTAAAAAAAAAPCDVRVELAALGGHCSASVCLSHGGCPHCALTNGRSWAGLGLRYGVRVRYVHRRLQHITAAERLPTRTFHPGALPAFGGQSAAQ